jgi:cytidine kinase
VDPTGAGDAFAGGFIGYIAQQENLKIRTFKEAVVHGNVMGSFAVEDFGVKRLLAITNEDIQKRFDLYRKTVEF